MNFNSFEHLNVICCTFSSGWCVVKCRRWCIWKMENGTKYPVMSLPHAALQPLPPVQFWPVVWKKKHKWKMKSFQGIHPPTEFWWKINPHERKKHISSWLRKTRFCLPYLSLFWFPFIFLLTLFQLSTLCSIDLQHMMWKEGSSHLPKVYTCEAEEKTYPHYF